MPYPPSHAEHVRRVIVKFYNVSYKLADYLPQGRQRVPEKRTVWIDKVLNVLQRNTIDSTSANLT